MPVTKQPRTTNSFKLVIGGAEAAGIFREVTGLDSESEITEFKHAAENGRNEIIKVPGAMKWSNIELKRGVDTSMDLWKWRDEVVKSGPENARKDCQLMLIDYDGSPIVTYTIRRAWPAKYVGASLNAGANEVAMESLTLAHEGLERQ